MAERVRDGKKAWKETQFKFLSQRVLVNADQTTKKANKSVYKAHRECAVEGQYITIQVQNIYIRATLLQLTT